MMQVKKEKGGEGSTVLQVAEQVVSVRCGFQLELPTITVYHLDVKPVMDSNHER